MNSRNLATVACLAGLACWSTAFADTFVLDNASPSLGTIPAGCEDVLNDGGPNVGINLASLGLVAGDCIDAISDGNDPIDVTIHGTKDHLFSVSRGSVGQVGSGVQLERGGDTAPPGGANGHAADLFKWAFPGPGNILAPVGDGWNGGTNDGDENNAGLVTPVIAAPGDNVVAYDVATLASNNPPPFEVYFSLAAGSPSLSTGLNLIPGSLEGDILVVGGFYGGTPQIFRAQNTIGIPAGTQVDLDALSLEVNPGAPPTLHMVEYSITAATATGFGLVGSGNLVQSGADVILWDGVGGLIGHGPISFGLDVDDEITALESILPPPPPVVACCFSTGACAEATEADCIAFGGTSQGTGSTCATSNCPQPAATEACCFNNGNCADLDPIDCAAFAGAAQGPGTDCTTSNCVPTISCPGDLNFDGLINSLDLQPFVDLLINVGTCPMPGPPNDDCANAAPVGEVTNLPFDTTMATFDGPGACQTRPNVWFCYTASCTGTATVETCGSTYDTVIGVYDTCAPGLLIGCNNDSSCGIQSVVSFPVIAGQQYKIEIGGAVTTGPPVGAGDLTIVCQ